MRSGMCSITMRQMGTDEVIALAVRAKLAGIEWGCFVYLRWRKQETAKGVQDHPVGD